MKIHTHFKLIFAIILLTLAHLQMKQGGTFAMLDPELVAAVVLVLMGSVFVGDANAAKKDEIKSPFLEKVDDYDMSA